MAASRVELVYFQGCPNVDEARAAIRAALAAEGLELGWREWDRDDPQTPEKLRSYGSPTVLVDGRDVAPAESQAACCRIYAQGERLLNAPSAKMIRGALQGTDAAPK